jgi:hypothetical protein
MIYVNFYGWDEPKWYWRVYQYLVNLFSPKFVHVDIQLPLIKQETVIGVDGKVTKNSGQEVLVTSAFDSGVQIFDLNTPSRKPRETYMLAVDVEIAWANIYPLIGKKYSFSGYPTAVFNTPRKKTQGLSCVETVDTVVEGCVGRDKASSSVIAEIRKHGISDFTPSELRDLMKACGVSKL